MKLIFNDATDMPIQSYEKIGGAVRFLTIGIAPEKLKEIFEDATKTKVMNVTERGQIIDTLENYTGYDHTEIYPGGIYGVVNNKAGLSTEERLDDMGIKLETAKQDIEALKKEKLPSVNQMVKNIKGALHDAGVDSKYIAAEIVRIYSDNGYPVKVPVLSDVPKLWDCTTMAKELGIFSESGRPHDKAMSAIIQKLDVFTEEIVKTAYSRNGHDGVTVQYKDSVLQKAKEWLEENGYPTMIEYRLSNGNINKCKVVYQEVA